MNSLQQQSQTYLDNNNSDIKSFALEALKLLPSGWGCRVTIDLMCYVSGNHKFEFTIYAIPPNHEDIPRAITGATRDECLGKIKKALEIHELSKTI